MSQPPGGGISLPNGVGGAAPLLVDRACGGPAPTQDLCAVARHHTRRCRPQCCDELALADVASATCKWRGSVRNRSGECRAASSWMHTRGVFRKGKTPTQWHRMGARSGWCRGWLAALICRTAGKLPHLATRDGTLDVDLGQAGKHSLHKEVALIAKQLKNASAVMQRCAMRLMQQHRDRRDVFALSWNACRSPGRRYRPALPCDRRDGHIPRRGRCAPPGMDGALVFQ